MKYLLLLLIILDVLWWICRRCKIVSNIIILLSLLVFVFILGFRNELSGMDTLSYLRIFNGVSDINIQEIFRYSQNTGVEPGFVLFSKIISLIYHNDRFFLLCNAALAVASLYIVSKNEGCCRPIFIMAIGTFGGYALGFNLMRQCDALALCMLAWYSKGMRKYIYYIVALSFHVGSLVILVFDCVKNLNLKFVKQKYREISLGILMLCIIGIPLGTEFINSKLLMSTRYGYVAEDQSLLVQLGFVWIVWVIVSIACLCIVLSRAISTNNEILIIFCSLTAVSLYVIGIFVPGMFRLAMFLQIWWGVVLLRFSKLLEKTKDFYLFSLLLCSIVFLFMQCTRYLS